jgi:transposase, IS30 family
MPERRQKQADRAIRLGLRSPGRPPPRREVEREFWRRIAGGLGARTRQPLWACRARWARAGPATVAAWHRSVFSSHPAGTCRSSNVRRSRCSGPRTTGCARSPAGFVVTARRSHASCVAMRLPAPVSAVAEPRWRSGRPSRLARRPQTAKLAANHQLRDYVQDRLSGRVRHPDGTEIRGPNVPAWKGRNKPHRKDRRWATSWSPEQISVRLEVDFPEDESMRISHEAIYQALCVQGRGALRRELTGCLRTGRALRVPRARTC